MLAIEVAIFGFTWWLGLYLASRDEGSAATRWAAGGLVSYAVALALNSLGQRAPDALGEVLRWQVPLLLAPLLFWSGALWSLRDRLRAIPVRLRSAENPPTAVGLLLIATVSFGLGLGLILAPLDWLPRDGLLAAIGLDLLVFGYAVGVLDAFELGESLLPSLLRSLIEAEAVALLLGGQVALLMWLETGVTFPLLVLLFLVVATAIALQVWSRQVQAWFDGVVYGRFPGLRPGLRQERAALRDLADALPRARSLPLEWDEEQFAQLTRRALSQLGNLPGLAASPLIHLPLIERRLSQRGLEDNTLVRSAELKALLVDAIAKLKPSDAVEFDTSNAWRHYNALFFPYVRGLRPYSRSFDRARLDPTDRRALEWFQREIPPRTLYNWQASAARLIAADLREQMWG